MYTDQLSIIPEIAILVKPHLPPRPYFANPAVFVPVFEVGIFWVLFAETCLQHPYDIEFCFHDQIRMTWFSVINGMHFSRNTVQLLLE